MADSAFRGHIRWMHPKPSRMIRISQTLYYPAVDRALFRSPLSIEMNMPCVGNPSGVGLADSARTRVIFSARTVDNRITEQERYYYSKAAK